VQQLNSCIIVQKALVKATSSKSSEEAEEKWPECCTVSKLEPKLFWICSSRDFLQLLPESNSTDDCTDELELKEESGDLFLLTSKEFTALFWRKDIMTLNSNLLATMLLCFRITDFNGFPFATFNFPDGKQEPNQDISTCVDL